MSMGVPLSYGAVQCSGSEPHPTASARRSRGGSGERRAPGGLAWRGLAAGGGRGGEGGLGGTGGYLRPSSLHHLQPRHLHCWQCALATDWSHHGSHISVVESVVSCGEHGAPCTQKPQPRHLHVWQWLCHSETEHQSSHVASAASPSTAEWHLHRSHALHLQRPQWLSRCSAEQKSSHRSSGESHTPIGASELHCLPLAPPSPPPSPQKPHRLHLHISQCCLPKAASQKSSHCSCAESSLMPDAHAWPARQKPQPLHLQREQWSSKNSALHQSWHSGLDASSA